MKSSNIAPRLLFLIGSLVFLLTSVTAQQPRTQQTDEVVRVNTDLVQTAITVIDKNGHFVDGLNRDQFELTIDGKPRPISFFERVTAGSSREAELLAADTSAAATDPNAAATSNNAQGNGGGGQNQQQSNSRGGGSDSRSMRCLTARATATVFASPSL